MATPVTPAPYQERTFNFERLEIIVKSMGFIDKEYAFGIEVGTPTGEHRAMTRGGELWVDQASQPVPPPAYEYLGVAGHVLKELIDFKKAPSDEIVELFMRKSGRILKSDVEDLERGWREMYAVSQGVSLETLESARAALRKEWFGEVPRQMLAPEDRGEAPAPPPREKPKWRK